MYVLRSGKSPNTYVDFDDRTNNTYSHTLAEAQRFNNLTELLIEVQEQTAKYRAEYPCGGILCHTFTIEKVIRKAVWVIKNRGREYVYFREDGAVDFTGLERNATQFDTEEEAHTAIQRRCARAGHIISEHLTVEGIITDAAVEVL